MQASLTNILSSAALLLVLATVAPQAAFARGGLATIGGGNPVTCAQTIRNVSLTSGGNRAKDQAGLGADNMHVYVEFMWRPCTSPLERLTVSIYDHETGELQVTANNTWAYPVGYDVKWTAYSFNGKFTHQYDVVIRTSDNTTGALVQEWRGSIITNNKL